MPRGRPQRRGTSQRYQPTDRRPREMATRASGDVDSGRGTEPHSDLPHPLQATGEDSCWDEDNPGNWSAVTLRQEIEARGLKLPSSMKKAQLLSLSLSANKFSLERRIQPEHHRNASPADTPTGWFSSRERSL